MINFNQALSYLDNNLVKDKDLILRDYKLLIRYTIKIVVIMLLLTITFVVVGIYKMDSREDNYTIAHIEGNQAWYIKNIKMYFDLSSFDLSEYKNGDYVYVYIDDNNKPIEIKTEAQANREIYAGAYILVFGLAATIIIIVGYVLYARAKCKYWTNYIKAFNKDKVILE